MTPNLTAPVTPEEFAALQEVGKGQMQRIISKEHQAKLVGLGYIKEGLGGLSLTDAGHMRLAAGR